MDYKGMAKQLDGETGEIFKVLKEHSRKTADEYLRRMTGNRVTNEMSVFFIQELLRICEENPKKVAYYDIFLFYAQTDKNGNYTSFAKEMQNYMSEAFKKAAERFENGERIIEERATAVIPEPDLNISHMISERAIESIIKKPEYYFFAHDKLNTLLSEWEIDGIKQPVEEEAKETAVTYITLDFDEAAKLTDLSEFTLRFTEKDKQIQEAVVTLIKANESNSPVIITAQQIYRTLTGNTGKRMTENWKNDIELSMRKFNSVRITADLTDARNIYPDLKEIDSIIRETRLIQFRMTTVKARNGAEMAGYEILEMPILYTISELKGLIGHFNIKFLENNKTTNSVDSTILKNYLLKRVYAMKSNRIRNSILFETLYSDLNRTTEKEKRTTRENAEKLLLQFVSDKLITGFNIENKGKTPHRILITPKVESRNNR